MRGRALGGAAVAASVIPDDGSSDETGHALELRAVTKRYGHSSESPAVSGVDLALRRGEFMTLLGPSGSGKTTILRLVAGFISPTEGSIHIDGRDVSRLSPSKRRVGLVMQHYALFPHMTVAENVAYGLKMRGWRKSDRRDRIDDMLALVGLAGLDDRRPRELSGGQQQRVALARALAFDPSLILMDEPLGALDRELRVRMTAELRRIHEQLGATVLYVTHDRDEALSMSDRVALMQAGVLDTVDTPQNLYVRPTSGFAARFFGGHNLLEATVVGGATTSPDTADVERMVTLECLGQTVETKTWSRLTVGEPAYLVVPPEALHVASARVDSDGGPPFALDAVVDQVAYMGQVQQLRFGLAGDAPLLTALLSPAEQCPSVRGASVRLLAEPSRLVAVPSGAGRGADATNGTPSPHASMEA